MSWTWAAGPWNGTADNKVDLGQATGRTFTLKRTDSSSAALDLAQGAQALGQIFPDITDVFVWHDGVLQFRGRAGGHSGQVALTAGSKSHSFADYREVLNRRALLGPNFGWTDTDPADAAWDVVHDEQQRVGSNLNITRGTGSDMVKTGAVDSLLVVVANPVREAVDTLAKLVTAGADWDISPTMQFQWWSGGRGTDRGLTIDLGGIAVSASDTADVTDYANSIRVSGQAGQGSSQTTGNLTTTFAFPVLTDASKFVKGQRIKIDNEIMLVTNISSNTLTVVRGYGGTTGATHAAGASVSSVEPAPYRLDVAGLASRPEGRWDVVETTSEVTDANLQQYAARSLAAHGLNPVTWTANLRRGWWQGRAHMDVGDPFTWSIPPNTPGFPNGLTETMTVEQIAVTFDDDQPEPAVSITFGAPPKGSRWKLRQIDRRLAALERR